MVKLPSGNVTFLCISASGPQGLTQGTYEAIQRILKPQRGLIFTEHQNYVQAVFINPSNAVSGAIDLQTAFIKNAELAGGAVSLAIHTGPAEPQGSGYLGTTLSRAMYLLAATHSGQILISHATREQIVSALPAGIELMDLGSYRLKDLTRPKNIFQVIAPGLPVDFPPLDTLDSHSTNLPIQPTPLLGRQSEIFAACNYLKDPQIRLLTLHGASGTGKTRLGLQVAVNLLDIFSDGVYFVSLAPVNDPSVVFSSIAQVLSVKERSGQALVEGLIAHLKTKHTLLILDNFEQVLSAAPFIERLITETQELKFLVTSQIPLKLAVEQVLDLPPLAVPDLAHIPAVDQLITYPAIGLFVERAQAARPSFRLESKNAAAVVELCSRLAGLPLAIELVAAHTNRLFPEDMLLMLRNRLQLGVTGKNGSSREHTLRHVLDWSCNLLTPQEQILFARLGVFTGGCTLDAVAVVCNYDDDLDIDILDGMEVLLEKHLLLQEELAHGDLRYIMLDAIHEYAGQRLAKSGEEEKLRQRHLEYYLAMAQEAEIALKGSQQEAWMGRLEGEHHNLRSALRWALEYDKVELAGRLSGVLGRFWYLQGHVSEGRRWYEAILANQPMLTAATCGKVLHGAGMLSYAQADYAQAVQWYEASLVVRRDLQDTPGIAALLNNLGIIASNQGDVERATLLYEECLLHWRATGDPGGISGIINNLGVLAYNQGNYQRAAELYEESLPLKRIAGDTAGLGLTLSNLGRIAYNLGNYERARTLFDEALGLWRDIGKGVSLGEILTARGRLAFAEGDLEQAEALLTEGLNVRKDLGNKRGLAYSLEAFAQLRAAQGQAVVAAQLLGAAARLREQIGAPLTLPDQTDYTATRDAIKSQIDVTAFEAAQASGKALTLEQALSLALVSQ